MESCGAGDIDKVKRAIENVSVYVHHRAETSPLIKAIEEKHDEIVNILLEIYERDLEVLGTTKFNKALVAMAEDQSEELLATLMSEPVGVVVPVLLKSSNQAKPTIAYLSKRKTHKNDRSIEFAHKLERKNGICDINWDSQPPCGCPNPHCIRDYLSTSALKTAINDKNDSLAKRLLSIPTIADKDYHRNFQLKLCVRDDNVEELQSLEPDTMASDLSILKATFENRNLEALLLVVDKMVKSGRFSFEKILQLEYFKQVQCFADAYFRLQFLRHFNLPFDEHEAFTMKKYGDNILHMLFEDKEEPRKVEIAKDLIESYPKLVTHRDGCERFPMFYALMNFGCANEDNLQEEADLVKLLYDKMVEQSGDADIINKVDMEKFLDCIVWAETGNLFALEHSETVSVLQKVLNGKLELLLQQRGLEVLHKTIYRFEFNSDEPELIVGFLLNQNLSKIDLNESREGSNAYQRLMVKSKGDLEMLKFFIEKQRPDLNAADSEGKTTFMYICEFCNDNLLIKNLIPQDPECVKRTTTDGRNCLFFIHSHDKQETSAELLQILLDAGADPHQVSENGERPIDKAAIWWNQKAFTTLLAIETRGKNSIKQWEPRIKKNVKKFFVSDGYLGEIWMRFADHINIDFQKESEGGDILNQILKTVTYENCLQMAPLEAWREELNKENEEGNTLLHVMLDYCYAEYKEHMNKIFELFYDEMDFTAVNNKNQSIAQVIGDRLHYLENLFDLYPKLLQTFNDRANEVGEYDSTPFKTAFRGNCYWYFDRILKHVSLENLRKNSDVIVECDMESDSRYVVMLKQLFEKYPEFGKDNESFLASCVDRIYKAEAFEVVLSAITNESLAKASKGSSNVLHLLCEKNKAKIIDLAITFLSDEQFNALKNQEDEEGRKPFDLLQYENKSTFEECFK